MSRKGALVKEHGRRLASKGRSTICERVSNAKSGLADIGAHGNLGGLEVFLFSKEHGETDDGSIDQKTANDGHDHGGNLDSAAVRKDGGEG